MEMIRDNNEFWTELLGYEGWSQKTMIRVEQSTEIQQTHWPCPTDSHIFVPRKRLLSTPLVPQQKLSLSKKDYAAVPHSKGVPV